MENKIYYAAMPILGEFEYYNEDGTISKEHGVVCYIISKCVHITTSGMYHEVVFPYHQVGNEFKYQSVSMDSKTTPIRCVFKNIETARASVNGLNNKIINAKIERLKYVSDLLKKEVIDNFNEEYKKYLILEDKIMEATPELDIKTNIDDQGLYNSRGEFLGNIFDVIMSVRKTKYIIYNTSSEEIGLPSNMLSYCDKICSYDGKRLVIKNAGTYKSYYWVGSYLVPASVDNNEFAYYPMLNEDDNVWVYYTSLSAENLDTISTYHQILSIDENYELNPKSRKRIPYKYQIDSK